MLIPEVTPTKDEIKAVAEGRMQFARGEAKDWMDVKKKAG